MNIQLDWNLKSMGARIRVYTPFHRLVPGVSKYSISIFNLIFSSTSGTCIPALSITITDFGPGNGLQCGRTSYSMNSSKISALMAPRKMLHVMYPSIVKAGSKERFSAFCVMTLNGTGFPLRPHPRERWPRLELMPDSSMNMSWSPRHCDSLTSQCWRTGSRSLASFASYF